MADLAKAAGRCKNHNPHPARLTTMTRYVPPRIRLPPGHASPVTNQGGFPPLRGEAAQGWGTRRSVLIRKLGLTPVYAVLSGRESYLLYREPG